MIQQVKKEVWVNNGYSCSYGLMVYYCWEGLVLRCWLGWMLKKRGRHPTISQPTLPLPRNLMFSFVDDPARAGVSTYQHLFVQSKYI